MRINDAWNCRIAVPLRREREVKAAALAKVSAEKRPQPGASAFRDREDDHVPTRKSARAAAQIPARPKHFRIVKRSFARVQRDAAWFAKQPDREYNLFSKMGAYWLRLVVGSAGGMSRMVRWPRKKPD